MLDLRSLGVSRGTQTVLRDVTLSVASGEFVGLIGPNGAGKTTLLRAALGLVPSTGVSSLAALTPQARARAAAYMPQGREVAWPMPVEAVVALGRTVWSASRADDRRATEAALARLNLLPLRHRAVTELSGGEQARVLLARALAQGAPLLLADEPTAGLDPAAQLQVMTLFRELATEGGAVVACVHDLGLAVRHCTRLIVVAKGGIAADGPPEQVLTPALLADVFGIRAYFAQTPEGAVFQPLACVP